MISSAQGLLEFTEFFKQPPGYNSMISSRTKSPVYDPPAPSHIETELYLPGLPDAVSEKHRRNGTIQAAAMMYGVIPAWRIAWFPVDDNPIEPRERVIQIRFQYQDNSP